MARHRLPPNSSLEAPKRTWVHLAKTLWIHSPNSVLKLSALPPSMIDLTVSTILELSNLRSIARKAHRTSGFGKDPCWLGPFSKFHEIPYRSETEKDLEGLGPPLYTKRIWGLPSSAPWRRGNVNSCGHLHADSATRNSYLNDHHTCFPSFSCIQYECPTKWLNVFVSSYHSLSFSLLFHHFPLNFPAETEVWSSHNGRQHLWTDPQRFWIEALEDQGAKRRGVT